MTFNVFEAINEVQEILNALEGYQQIEEASKLTAFFNKLTGKKGLRAPQNAKQVKQILKRKDSQISQANSNVKAASNNLNSAGKKVIKAHNKMLDTRAEMENTLPQEHKRVLKSLKGSHDGLTQGNLKSLTKDYDKNTGEEAIKKAQKVVNNYKTAVANKKQAASNLETAKNQQASNKEGADRIFNAAVRYKANQVKKNVADAKNHVGGYIKNFHESVMELRESFPSIFEGSQKEVNKIKKEKKNDKNEPVEVVSVADELFPREGNAKQQYNQKVLDIINGMIEGTNTLEDLIQFVRKQKVQGVKESFDLFEEKLYNEIENLTLLEEVINELKDSTLKSAADKAEQIADAQEESEPNAKDKEWVKTEASRRRHQSGKMKDYYENQVIKREKEKYEKSKEGNKSKEN